jgi:hypothetical protein
MAIPTDTDMQRPTTTPITRTRITPIRMRTALRNSSITGQLRNSNMALRNTGLRNSNSTVLRRTGRRNNSSSTLPRRTVLRNNSSTVKDLRRPRNKPRRSRTRLLAIPRHRRNPAPTPARMASGTVLAKSLLSKTPSKTARLHAASPKGRCSILLTFFYSPETHLQLPPSLWPDLAQASNCWLERNGVKQ